MSASHHALSADQLVWQVGSDGNVTHCNTCAERYFDTSTGFSFEAILQRILHPGDLQTALESWKRAWQQENTWNAEIRLAQGDGRYLWHRLSMEPVKGEGGSVEWSGSAIDIHIRKQSEMLAAAQMHVLELIALDRPTDEVLRSLCLMIEEVEPGFHVSIAVLDDDKKRFIKTIAPSFPAEYAAALEADPLGVPYMGACAAAVYEDRVITCDDVASDPRWHARWRNIILRHGGRAVWSTPVHNASGAPVASFFLCFPDPENMNPSNQQFIDAGVYLAEIALGRQVLEQKREKAEADLREHTDRLSKLISVNTSVAAEHDLETIVKEAVDAGKELSGAQFGAFFYNVEDENGESYTLYSLSGASRESFSKFPMPRNTEVFGPTFRGAAVIRLDDVKKDPRYGKNAPYNGMPEGHLPVTSYLAVPVVSRSGEVIGGLFYGHPEPGVFTESAESLVTAIAAQAAVAIDNSRLHSSLVGKSQQLRMAMSAGKLAVYEWRRDSNHVEWDAGLRELAGFPPDSEPTAELFASRIYPEDFAEIRTTVSQAISDQKPRSLQFIFRFTHPDGETRWFSSNSTLLFEESEGSDEPSPRLIGTISDITEAKRSDEMIHFQARLLDVVGEAVIATDTSERGGNVTYWNEFAEKLYGWSASETMGKNLRELLIPADAATKATSARTQIDGGQTWTGEFPLMRRDGSRFIGHVTVTPMYDLAGNLTGAVGLSKDVTADYKAREALKESQERLLAALSASSTGTYKWDLRTNEFVTDESLDRLLGIPPETRISTFEQFMGCVHPEDRAEVDALRMRSAGEGKDVSRELRVVWPDGSVHWLYERGRTFIDDAGVPVYITGACVDITDRKEWESALEEANRTLERRVSERTVELEALSDRLRLLANQLTETEQRERQRLAELVHDHLQQLLVATRMRIVIAQKQANDEPQQDLLKASVDLLDQSIKESRSLSAQLRPPVLYEGGLEPALQWLASWVKQTHGLDVEVESDSITEPDLETVGVLLFESVRELLLNTVKHSNAERALIKLEQADPENLLLTVRDDGKGFDLQELKNRNGDQVGFGLFSIRERLAVLGGGFEIESSPGEGTTARLLAPVTHIESESESAVKPEATAEEAKQIVADVRVRNSFDGKVASGTGQVRIVVADDHTVVRQGLVHMLQSEPDIVIVGEAENGASAVSLAEQLLPDIMILDVNMPQMNGIEAAEAISGQSTSTRIIGLSIHDDEATKQRMIDAGASAYLPKDGPISELLATIKALTGRNGDSPNTGPPTPTLSSSLPE